MKNKLSSFSSPLGTTSVINNSKISLENNIQQEVQKFSNDKYNTFFYFLLSCFFDPKYIDISIIPMENKTIAASILCTLEDTIYIISLLLSPKIILFILPL